MLNVTFADYQIALFSYTWVQLLKIEMSKKKFRIEKNGSIFLGNKIACKWF